MRKSFTRFLIALSAILFSVLPSHARWDTRFWPASEKPTRKGAGTNAVFQSDVISSNLFEAVLERTWAIERTKPSLYDDVDYLPTRKPDEILANLKGDLLQRIPSFLDQSRFPEPFNPGSLVVVDPETDLQEIQLIYWTPENILAFCNLPTNFFNYTPTRNLSGHAGFISASNDVLYGWDAMRKILTNLIYTVGNNRELFHTAREIQYEEVDGYPEAGRDLDWSKPSSGCTDDPITGPIDISEQDYGATVDIFTVGKATRALGFVPQYIFTYRSLFEQGTSGWKTTLMIDENDLDGSQLSQRLFTQAQNKAHFYRIKTKSSGQTIEYGGDYSANIRLGDGFYVLYGSPEGAGQIEGSIWDLLPEPPDLQVPNDVISVDVFCNFQNPTRPDFPIRGELFMSNYGTVSDSIDLSYVNIIEWDFTYK